MAMSKQAQVPEIVETEEQRLALLAAERLEKELRVFSGGLPYDCSRVIERTQDGLKRGLGGFYDAGLGLILLHEHEGVHTYALILEQHFPGISRRAAFTYMKFSRAAAKLPNFKAFCEEKGGFSKGLTMLTACTEEELAEFEAGGDLKGYKPDEIEMMSVRQLQKALRKADDDKARAVAAATHLLESEKEALADKVEGLEAQLAEAATPVDKALGLIKAAEKRLFESFQLLGKVSLEVVAADKVTYDFLIGVLALSERVIGNLLAEVSVAGRMHTAGEPEEGEVE